MSIFDKFKKSKETVAPVKSSTKETPAVDNKKVSVSKEPAKVKIVKESSAKPTTTTKSLVSKSAGLQSILVKPLITEKATNLVQLNQYVFEVSRGANKIQVAQAIEARYGVKPKKVNMLNNQGKITRRGRTVGKTKDWKKAIVTLPTGQTIKVHEGV